MTSSGTNDFGMVSKRVMHGQKCLDFSDRSFSLRKAGDSGALMMRHAALLSALVIGTLVNAEDATTPQPCTLKNEDNVFYSRGLTESDFFIFEKSGAYRVATRMHAGYLWHDNGYWKAEPQGELLICSQQQYKDLSLPGGSIQINEQAFVKLHHDRDGLEALLRQTNNAAFNRSELIERWDFSYSGGLVPGGRTITRQQLEEVLAQLESYLEEANLFRARVWKCGSRVFLTGDMRFVPPSERAFKKACQPEACAMGIPYRIDKSEAAHQMSRLQPFLSKTPSCYIDVRLKTRPPPRPPKARRSACGSFFIKALGSSPTTGDFLP